MGVKRARKARCKEKVSEWDVGKLAMENQLLTNLKARKN
jgi:hypothetical protein